jgi:hypothetical protein
VKKLLGWVVIAVIVLWVLNQPSSAAHVVHQFTNALHTLATSL